MNQIIALAWEKEITIKGILIKIKEIDNFVDTEGTLLRRA